MGHTKFSRGPHVETPHLDHHILEQRMCVCASVCCQFNVLIRRWRLLQSGGCYCTQYKILVGATASQEVDACGYKC